MRATSGLVQELRPASASGMHFPRNTFVTSTRPVKAWPVPDRRQAEGWRRDTDVLRLRPGANRSAITTLGQEGNSPKKERSVRGKRWMGTIFCNEMGFACYL